MADVARPGNEAPVLAPHAPLEERAAAARERHALHQAEGVASVQELALWDSSDARLWRTPCCHLPARCSFLSTVRGWTRHDLPPGYFSCGAPHLTKSRSLRPAAHAIGNVPSAVLTVGSCGGNWALSTFGRSVQRRCKSGCRRSMAGCPWPSQHQGRPRQKPSRLLPCGRQPSRWRPALRVRPRPQMRTGPRHQGL